MRMAGIGLMNGFVDSRLSDHIPDFISLIIHVNHSSNGRKKIISLLADALSNTNSYEDLGETMRRVFASLKEHDIADSSDLVSYLKLKFCLRQVFNVEKCKPGKQKSGFKLFK